MATKVSGGATATADSEDQFVIQDLKPSYTKSGAPAIPRKVWCKHFPKTADCTLANSTGQKWDGRVTLRQKGTATSLRAEITTGWPAFVRANGIVQGMDLQVAVTVPNTLTITVLRRPEAPSAAAAPSPKEVSSNGAAVSGQGTGTSAALSSRKRRKARPSTGSVWTVAKQPRSKAANRPRAVSAYQSAGAAAAYAHVQAEVLAAGANNGSLPMPPSGTQLPEQPAAADNSPADVQTPSLLSRPRTPVSNTVRQSMQQTSDASNAAPALPPPDERPAAVGEPVSTQVDASGATAAAGLQHGAHSAAPSAPFAMTQHTAAAAQHVVAQAAAAAAPERQQRTASAVDGPEVAVLSSSSPASAGEAADAAQAGGSGTLAASRENSDADTAAAADLLLCLQPPAASTPKSVAVTCNGVPGVFHVAEEVVECRCCECKDKAERDGKPVFMAPEEFERHAGKAHCQKWRYTLQVDDGSGSPQWLGNWLRARDIVLASDW